MGLVGVAGPPPVVEGLEVGLQRLQRLRVDQLPQLLGAQQLGQHLPVEGEGLGPALGQRGVALVEEVGDVLEGQRLGERRRRGGVDGDHPDRAGPDGGHQLGQRRQVEDVAQALAVGLQQDREVAVPGRHRQQVGGPLALLPERACGCRAGGGAGAGPGPRSPGSGTRTGPSWPARRRPGPRSPRARAAPSRRAATRRPRAGGRRCPRRSTWSGPRCRAGRGPGPRWPAPTARGPGRRGATARRSASRPGRRGSARRRSGGRWAGRRRWPRAPRPGRPAGSTGPAGRASTRSASCSSDQSPTSRRKAPMARPSSAGRPRPSPCQNGILPGWPGAGVTTTRSRVISSIRQVVAPEQERLAHPALVDHLLVELADPVALGREHAVEAPVGDGAAADDGQHAGAGPGPERALGPVPDDAGPQLGELVGRVAAGQHVEDVLEQRPACSRRTGRRRRPPRPPPRPSARRPPPWPRSAGPGRRGGCGGPGSPR